MNCPIHFNGTPFSKPNVSELVHFASEAIIVSKPSYSIAMAQWSFHLIRAILALVHACKLATLCTAYFLSSYTHCQLPCKNKFVILAKYLVTTIV